jgi:hypothetical protein
MKNINRQLRSLDPLKDSTTRTAPTAYSSRRTGADKPPPTDRPGIRLKWRTLDRLEAAATLGIILAAPRSALLVLDRLGSRIPPSTATTAIQPDTVTSRRRISS